MKIGVISDTHIPERAKDIPAKILEGLKGVDMILHAGDLANLSVIDRLKKVCKDVRSVQGNMDPQEVKDKLPQKLIIPVGKFKIALMHGYGSPAGLPELLTKVFKDDFVDAIVFGHSHIPMNEVREKILFFNPGSATDKIFSSYNSYGILEVNEIIEGRIIKV